MATPSSSNAPSAVMRKHQRMEDLFEDVGGNEPIVSPNLRGGEEPTPTWSTPTHKNMLTRWLWQGGTIALLLPDIPKLGCRR